MITRRSPVPLYAQIEQTLRGRIRSGELAVNEQLPSETELANEFGVSRMTARKGVDALVAENLIFRRPGKGTFVAAAKIPHGFSTTVSFSAAMDDLGLPHRTKLLEASMVEADEDVAAALDVPAGTRVVQLRRLRIVGDDPVAIHSAWLPSRFAVVLAGNLEGSLTEQMRLVGAEIDHARDTIEAVGASPADAEILGIPDGSPVVRIVGTAYSPSQEPLRFTRAIYRADRFRFTADTKQPQHLRVEVVDVLAS